MIEGVVPSGKPIKLVVWTLEGSLLLSSAEDGAPVHPLARSLVATLDERGVLQSIVGNADDVERAQATLQRLGLAQFFLYPRLGTRVKSQAVREIAAELNVGLGSVLVIDGEPLECKAVAQAYPEVRCLAPAVLEHLADDPLMGHSLAGIEARPRRLIYLEEQARKQSQSNFAGSDAEFLATLDMQITVSPAGGADLARVKELVNRANQLCVTYTDEELTRLLRSPEHLCWLVSLRDRFGDCGQVGLALIETASGCWTLQLLLFSCRVMAREIDAIVTSFILRRARSAGVRLLAQFKRSSRNDALWLAYQRAGFRQIGTRADLILLEHSLARIARRRFGARLFFSGE
jgi:FkbH-like protein